MTAAADRLQDLLERYRRQREALAVRVGMHRRGRAGNTSQRAEVEADKRFLEAALRSLPVLIEHERHEVQS